MGYWHSLYSQETRNGMMANHCNYSYVGFDDNYDKLSLECRGLFDYFTTVTEKMNIYDIFGYCWPANEHTSMNLFHKENYKALTEVGGIPRAYKKFFT